MPSSRLSGFKGLRVLVTGGPTAVPLDSVRVLTNCSTGEMGRIICRQLTRAGAKVTLLEGAVQTSCEPGRVTRKGFFFFAELSDLLDQELSRKYDVVIHAAAVSDFMPRRVSSRKLPSGGGYSLKLRPAPKLVSRIKKLDPAVFLVAFKLEDRIAGAAVEAKVAALFRSSQADLVLLNSLTDGYQARLLRPDGSSTEIFTTKEGIVKVLLNELRMRKQ